MQKSDWDQLQYKDSRDEIGKLHIIGYKFSSFNRELILVNIETNANFDVSLLQVANQSRPN